MAHATREALAAQAAATHLFPETTLAHLTLDPFILVSTHGVYDKRSTPFRVPENVYIFETQEVTDYCLTTIDVPLQWLLSNRLAFMNCITANPSCENSRLIDTFKQFAFYEPGDVIYNRILSIGGGRGARRVYNMNFYKYPTSEPPTKILPELRIKLSNESQDTTMLDVINATLALPTKPPQPPLKNGVVFFFSSCAEARDLKKSEMESIAEVQQKARLKFLSYTPIARGGPFEAPARAVGNRLSTRLTTESFHPSAYDAPPNNAMRATTPASWKLGMGGKRRTWRMRRKLRTRQSRKHKNKF